MDAVFKALNDPTRRRLLDMLRERDGQTLTELESGLGMTRFGVMKHLKVLEAASLVTTHKAGRMKHHYLNAVPLQDVIDRWVEPLIQKPLTRAALDLKAKLEGSNPMSTATLTKPDFVLRTFIKTTPAKLWRALIDGEMTARYYINWARLDGEIVAGGRYRYLMADGSVMLSGEVLEAIPEKRLEMTFVPGWAGPDAQSSRVVMEIAPAGEMACKLTIAHYGLPAGQEGVEDGWAKIAAKLKSFLETGEAFEID